MSLGRTSTFLDVYLQRALEEGILDETRAQELIDDFLIKLPIVRFLRPRYLFRGPAMGPLASGPGMTVSPCRTNDLGGGVAGPGRCRRRR